MATPSRTKEAATSSLALRHGVEEEAAAEGQGPPDGGLKAWMVVAGGFLTYFVTFGLLNSFGTFQAYYGTHVLPERSASAISWIGSVQLFLLFIGGLVFGPLFDTKGARVLLVPGTVALALALMLMSVCRQYYQFILTQSLLLGVGVAMLFYPTISAIPHWFHRRRGLAMGVVVSGSSLGGMAWPLLLDRLFGAVGFGWTLRIVGFISLALLAPACVFIVPRLPPRRRGDVPKAEMRAVLQDTTFWLLVTGMLLVMWGMFIPLYYLPLYGMHLGLGATFSNDLLTILNAGSLVGRVLSGALADKIGSFNTAILCSLLSGIVLLCLHAMRTKAAVLAFAVLYGLFSGGLISLQTACVAQITDNMQLIGVKIGLMMAVCSIGALTGSPIGGALVAANGGEFYGLISFAGGILLAGTAILGSSRWTMGRRLPGAVAADGLYDCVAGVLGDTASQRIVRPQDATYLDARLGEAIQYDELPLLISYAESASEVGSLVQCAQAAGVKAVPRSGGHSFTAFSALNGTLVVDIAHLNDVVVSDDGQSARVGAGIRLGALYTALAMEEEHDVSFVGGICPTVGLAGFLGSGGFNMQQRSQGLAVDHVLAARVVLADGRTVVASSCSHPDLFWALRGGGGGTFGIVVEFTLALTRIPRSAMLLMTWSNDTASRFPVARRFLDWAPRQEPSFMAQLNIYRDTVSLQAMHYGASRAALQDLVDRSGLADMGRPEVIVAGGCSAHNARLFGYTVFDCVPDNELDASILNVAPDPFSPVGDHPWFQYDEAPKSDAIPPAAPWERFHRLSKSFFVDKEAPLPDDVVQGLVDRVAAADEASEVWAEWHAWNISDAAASSPNAFPWRDRAYAHLEFQMHGSEDEARQATYEAWFAELESYLRPSVGPASYSGYMDADISTEPLTSYYGDSVCRLIEVKKAYDPDEFFTNPFSIPASPPEGMYC
ncbi:FAD-binding-domain-containing protein [Emericellopsis cladophorae]|uniref:FAD-binding-domain-containing protein n=1 Tax=Emericellopsis cladophorae TaxID=2686198 RepID=A0A9P9Y490_9HYPO|nr:FAD-binding-domain-containing protein [Emericellopsis cladophorae]KAI6782828.1 FAD-binding-domain-containing protein [Emericellopsis cladophorae]